MEGDGGVRRREDTSRGKGRVEDEMEQLLKDLRLTEGELSGVRVGRKKKSGTRVEEEMCLVGRLLTMKQFNVDALAKTLTMVWRPSRGMDYKVLEGNLILFQFYEATDMRRVLPDGPWSFDGYALILKEFEGDKRPTDITFDSLPIWARIYNLPLDCMTKLEGEKLGASLGEVMEVEVDKGGKAWGRYMRIRIKLYVNTPLPRGVMLYLGEDDEQEGVWCRAAYEKLPNYCYHCGKLDHIDKDCKVPNIPGQKPQYGAWLRASPGKKKAWGGGTYEGKQSSPRRSEGDKRIAKGNLLDRFNSEAKTGERREESSQGRQLWGIEREDMAASASSGRPSQADRALMNKAEKKDNDEEGGMSGQITKDGPNVERPLSNQALPTIQAVSDMEVMSPHKKMLQEASGSVTGSAKAKKARKRHTVKSKVGQDAEGRKIKEANVHEEKESGVAGKRRLREEEAERVDIVELKTGRQEKKGKWVHEEVMDRDDDMLLVDMVGAELQPHQAQ